MQIDYSHIKHKMNKFKKIMQIYKIPCLMMFGIYGKTIEIKPARKVREN